MHPYRTVLEQKIRERRLTLEEFAAYAEDFAREHGEPGTLSLRHLQRLAAGKGPKGRALGPIRPATARLLERIFETDASELLASPMQALAPPGDDAADLRERIQKSRRVDAGMLQGLHDQLNTIRRIDRQYGAIVTHNELLAKISETRDLLTYSLTGNTRRELAILLSEMHALAGWQSLDMGECSASWRHYEQAKADALESENIAYHAHASAEQAFTLVDLGETAVSVELLQVVLKSAKNRCSQRLYAWLSAAHGEVLAADNRIAESLSTFDEVSQLLPCESEEEVPYIVIEGNHFDRWLGHVLARCGHREAVTILARASEGLESSFTRAQSSLRVDLAVAFVREGEYGSAIRESRWAYSVASELGSIRQKRRAAGLLESSLLR